MPVKLIVTLLFIAGFHALQAQETTNTTPHSGASNKRFNLEHTLVAGFNIGALTPVSLPNTIRKIEGYAPKFCPAFGYKVAYALNQKWKIGTGVKLEWKGMVAKDSVLYMHSIITVKDGDETNEFEGNFSGRNTTTVQNSYLSFPVEAFYQPNKKWKYSMGLYLAFLLKASFIGEVYDGYIRSGNSLGEKVTVTTAGFDFSTAERTFDWGLTAGAERSVGKRFGVQGSLQWGFRPAFASTFKGVSFNMYNIFATVGATYRLFP